MSDDASNNDKSPIEQAVEMLLYAPIGLLIRGPAVLPRLLEEGRAELARARVIGKFALQQGWDETARELGDQAAGVLDFLGDSLSQVGSGTPLTSSATLDGRGGARERSPERPTSSGRAAAAARTGAKAGTPADAATADTPPSASAEAPAGTVGTAPSTASQPPAPDGPAPSAADLAIPDYDGLSASHVVNRLAGLSPDELEAVRAYEAANRGRKTILNKIAQLQSA